ncbi:2'-5' RNA ligase family protein [Pseudoalteromonas sp. SG43-6]|uniref:DUF1045 domain-containing protein n=1 Tax=Pseudoalteromonas sp. SG43-6 TaxID=2760967 RepID=UPI0016011099|nr:2'-5' RNA ligase family protein [Pseudoalteromonas sp. SG43-6]MBB1434475.1 2'-5' RNA ligase family protein [Pseudoalteromonas sp. SG43-6]
MFKLLFIKPPKLLVVTLITLIIIPLPSFAKSVSINVFAIPSKSIINLVEQTSDALKKEGIMSFYEKGKPVHATLYLTDFVEGSEEDIKRAVKSITEQHQEFAITAQGFTVTQSNWAFINLQYSPKLQRLADEVTMAIEPLRDTNATIPSWVKNYPNKLTAFERYGSPNVFQNFQPHLTLLANEKSPKLVILNKQMQAHPPEAQGKIIGIGIGISDPFGQQKQVIAEYFFNNDKN